MDPPIGCTSGTLSRRVKSTKSASGRHRTGRCWRGSRHHLTGPPRQGHSHHHRMTGMSHGLTLYQTGRHRRCRCQRGSGCRHSPWSPAWWTRAPLRPSLPRPTPPFSDPHRRTFIYYSRLNLTKNIFHLLNVFPRLLKPWPTNGPERPGRRKTTILLSEVRRSRRLRSSEVSDCTADIEKTKKIMYKRTIIIYNRSKRFLFIRRKVASANCKCIIPQAPLAAPTPLLCDS